MQCIFWVMVIAIGFSDITLFAYQREEDYFEYEEVVGMNEGLQQSSLTENEFASMPMVSAGNAYTLALKSDGTVWSWGSNTQGQLGDGTTTMRSTPVQVQIPGKVISIAAGHTHAVALKENGTVWSWGSNAFGQLGDGTTTNRSTPGQVQNLNNIIAITAGNGFAVALRNDGIVFALGLGGQLGNGTTTGSRIPVQVQNISNITAISAGDEHTLAMRSDGTIWAWGRNAGGQLGDGTTTRRLIPVQVQNFNNITAIATGGFYTAVIRNGNSIWTWGLNSSGQLGDGTTTTRLTPVQIQNIGNVNGIFTGSQHTIARSNNSTLRAWGLNSSGQLGDGTITNRLTPVQVQNINSAVSVTGGLRYTVVLRDDGTVWAWGYNLGGQLGDGTTIGRITPVQVVGPNGVGFLNLGPTNTGSTLELNGTRVSKTISYVPVSANLIDVTLMLETNPGIYSFLTDLVFDDTKLTPVSVTGGPIWDNSVELPLVSGGRYPNRRIFLAMGTDISYETGVIATVRFRVNGQINHALPIAIGQLDVVDSDGNNGFKVLSTLTDSEEFLLDEVHKYASKFTPFSSLGSVYWTRIIAGKFTGGGQVNLSDAAYLAGILIGNIPENDLHKYSADVNGDGVINLFDLISLSRYMVGDNVILPIHLNYRILVNSGGVTISQAETIMSAIRDGFWNEFRVKLVHQYSTATPALNMRGSCLQTDFCNANCGALQNCKTLHHRSANHFIEVWNGSDINTFRFVNFRLCWHHATSGVHRWVGGLASSNKRDIIMVYTVNGRRNNNIAAHEISHLLGAHDNVCSNSTCVMEDQSEEFKIWCTTCIGHINSSLRFGRR